MGWCAAENGDPARGSRCWAERLPRWRLRILGISCLSRGLLAQVHMKVGHHADAMKATDNAIALAAGSGERFYTAELHRLRGELLARRPGGHLQKAEASFRTAIEVARRQGATTLENKAIASLRRWCDVATLG
jgi:predicted ATPase